MVSSERRRREPLARVMSSRNRISRHVPASVRNSNQQMHPMQDIRLQYLHFVTYG